MSALAARPDPDSSSRGRQHPPQQSLPAFWKYTGEQAAAIAALPLMINAPLGRDVRRDPRVTIRGGGFVDQVIIVCGFRSYDPVPSPAPSTPIHRGEASKPDLLAFCGLRDERAGSLSCDPNWSVRHSLWVRGLGHGRGEDGRGRGGGAMAHAARRQSLDAGADFGVLVSNRAAFTNKTANAGRKNMDEVGLAIAGWAMQ